MSIAIFDLDDTLLSGDSATLWGEYIVANNLVANVDDFREKNRQFDEDYRNGCFVPMEYVQFIANALEPLSPDDLLAYNHLFLEEMIRPIIRHEGLHVLHDHKERGDITMIATSTIEYLANPIAHVFEADVLIATKLEKISGHYTGSVVNTPCYGIAKKQAVYQWMQENDVSWEGSYMYSDSDMDTPLLEAVEYAVAVTPNSRLRHIAEEKQWQIYTQYFTPEND